MERMAAKPRKLTLCRGEILNGPLVSADGIYVSARDADTIKLDRKSLKPLWRVASDRHEWLRDVCGNWLVVNGKKGPGVRSADDGSLLWFLDPGDRLVAGHLWREALILHRPSEPFLEIRDIASGSPQRRIDLPEPMWPRCVHSDLWIGSHPIDQAKLYTALDLRNGHLVWQQELSAETERRVGQHFEHDVLVLGGSRAGPVIVGWRQEATFGFSAADGNVLWHVPVDTPSARPLVADGKVFNLKWQRFVVADEATGRILCDVHHPDLRPTYRAKFGPLYKGRVALACESGHIIVLDANDGRLHNLFHDRRYSFWRSAEADGRLLVGGADGSLFVFDEWIWGPL